MILCMTWPMLRRRAIMVDNVEYRLTPREHQLVTILLMRRGQAVAYGDIIEMMWPDDNEPDYARSMLSVFLCRLRKRIDIVRTVTGFGLMIPA